MPRLRRAETPSDWSFLLGPLAERGGARKFLEVSRNPYFGRAYGLFALEGEVGPGRAAIHRDDAWCRDRGRAVGWVSLLDESSTPEFVEEVMRWARDQGLQELRTYRGTSIAQGLGWSPGAGESALRRAGYSPEVGPGHSDWSVVLTDAPFLERIQAEWERQRESRMWASQPLVQAVRDWPLLARDVLSSLELDYIYKSVRHLVVEPASRFFQVDGAAAGAWLALDPTAPRWFHFPRRRERLFVLTFPMLALFKHLNLEAAALAEVLRTAASQGWREVVFLAVDEDKSTDRLREELTGLGCSKGKVLPSYRVSVRSTQ